MPLLDKLQNEESKLTVMHGKLPQGSLVNGKLAGKPINDSTDQGRYQDYVVNTGRATDQTDSSTVTRTQG
jgi:hypothetical protein